jgi:hypothetical protein
MPLLDLGVFCLGLGGDVILGSDCDCDCVYSVR